MIKDNNPWFDIFGMCQPADGLMAILNQHVSSYNISVEDDVIWLSEPGMYQLFECGQLFGSTSFRNWLITDVLPVLHEEVGHNIWEEYAAVAQYELDEITNENGYIFIATCDKLQEDGLYILDAGYNVWWRIRYLDDTNDNTWRVIVQYKSKKHQKHLAPIQDYFSGRHVSGNYYHFLNDDAVKEFAMAYKKK